MAKTGIYHTMIRGINQQRLFEDDEDYRRYLGILVDASSKSGCRLLAYCLMSNHAHILVDAHDGSLEQMFRVVGVRYVPWFNAKYSRSGHLFQDRFKSEPVDDEAYLPAVIGYIHQNPVKSSLCGAAEDYTWSSRCLLGKEGGVIDEKRLAELVAFEDIVEAEGIPTDAATPLITMRQRRVFTDEEAAGIIASLSGAKTTTAFQALDKDEQARAVLEMRRRRLPIRQIARLTGIPKGVVEKWSKAT
jgi:REP element-mobilizing transposase RayT